jgi:hypothetical protein
MLGQFLGPTKVAELAAQARRSAAPCLLLDDRDFQSSYNERPFLVRHRLAEHPRFQFDSLAALCRRLPRDQVRYRFGVVPVDAEFNSSIERFRGDLTLEDALDHMEEKQAYIAVYNPETDAEYAPVIEGLLGELAARTEPIEPGLNWFSTYIFVSAKESITPYHMDREMNFLLQIRGTKQVKLWDGRRDDDIMTPSQRDRMLTERHEPRPPYQPSFEAKAMLFDLAPGLGVHHPFIAPHLVTTGPELSISLAITFRTDRSDLWTDAHRFSHRLRGRVGTGLGVVGRSPFLDATKAGLVRLGRRAKRVLRRRAE